MCCDSWLSMCFSIIAAVGTLSLWFAEVMADVWVFLEMEAFAFEVKCVNGFLLPLAAAKRDSGVKSCQSSDTFRLLTFMGELAGKAWVCHLLWY